MFSKMLFTWVGGKNIYFKVTVCSCSSVVDVQQEPLVAYKKRASVCFMPLMAGLALAHIGGEEKKKLGSVLPHLKGRYFFFFYEMVTSSFTEMERQNKEHLGKGSRNKVRPFHVHFRRVICCDFIALPQPHHSTQHIRDDCLRTRSFMPEARRHSHIK